MNVLRTLERASGGCLAVAILVLVVPMADRRATQQEVPQTLPALPADSVPFEADGQGRVGVILFASIGCPKCPGIVRALQNVPTGVRVDVRFLPSTDDNDESLRQASAAECGIGADGRPSTQLALLVPGYAADILASSATGAAPMERIDECVSVRGPRKVRENVQMVQVNRLPLTPLLWVGRTDSAGKLAVHYQILEPSGLSQALLYLSRESSFE